MRQIQQLLKEIRGVKDVAKATSERSYPGLDKNEIEQFKNSGQQVYQGKVRDVVIDGEQLRIIHSDRLSAFDRYIGLVPYKGIILNAISEYWLKEAEQVVPSHFQKKLDARTLLVEKLEPVKVEIVVRGYLAGSMLRAYERGERIFCGVKLPDELKAYQKLPELLITPTTKAQAYQHDENISEQEILQLNLCTKREWDFICDKSRQLFTHGEKVFKNVGWILVDTKYEFGRTKNGAIKIIDEVHTPDSSRLWVYETYQKRLANNQLPDMLDKELIRRYLVDQGFTGEGEVPKIPPELFVQLSEVYLKVAETLLKRKLEV